MNANTPDRSTAAAFPRYLTGEVVADSVALHWPGLYARRWRHPRVVDRFLVPATPEPHISCNLRGMAEFRERDVGGAWITRQIRWGDLFVTRSRTPDEVRFESPPGQELDNLSLHIAVEPFLTALEARYPGSGDRMEVVDFFGRDEILWPTCLTCAELLAARVPGKSPRVAALTQLFAANLVEQYTDVAAKTPAYRGGLPIRQLRKVEDHVTEHLAEEISIDSLAELVELSSSHFSHVFKESTGMTPLQFVTRQRITRAQQLIRETSRSLIEVGLEVGYTSPSTWIGFRRVRYCLSLETMPIHASSASTPSRKRQNRRNSTSFPTPATLISTTA